ncbi:MAG: hypothetical protein ACKVTZ_09075, partial [Bacteroidia bacterium]
FRAFQELGKNTKMEISLKVENFFVPISELKKHENAKIEDFLHEKKAVHFEDYAFLFSESRYLEHNKFNPIPLMKEVKKLLAQQKFKEVFEVLYGLYPDEDEIYATEGRYNRNKTEYEAGRIKFEEYEVGLNRIQAAILSFIEKLDNREMQKVETALTEVLAKLGIISKEIKDIKQDTTKLLAGNQAIYERLLAQSAALKTHDEWLKASFSKIQEHEAQAVEVIYTEVEDGYSKNQQKELVEAFKQALAVHKTEILQALPSAEQTLFTTDASLKMEWYLIPPTLPFLPSVKFEGSAGMDLFNVVVEKYTKAKNKAFDALHRLG